MAQSAKFGFLLFVVALAFRLVGIAWGLPGPLRETSLHPDEPINWMVTHQAADLTPDFYNYGTLYFSLQNTALVVLHAAGLGLSPSGEGTVAGLAQEFLAGRCLSALAGAGIVWVVWIFLFRRVHWAGALAGSLAVLFAPGLVVHSRFMTVDVIATLLITLSLYWSSEAMNAPKGKWFQNPYLLAGLFAGLAAACKYNGILALIAIAPAIGSSQDRVRNALTSLSVAVLAFVAGVPGVILESGAFMRDFSYEMWHTGAGHGLVFAGTAPGFIYHWSNLFVAMGMLLVLMGVAGLARLCYRRHPWAIGLALFFLAYFLLIGKAEVKFMRYVFPLIPVLAIGFGWLVGQMQSHPDRRKWSWGVALAIFALGFDGLRGSADATVAMMGTDPRDQAAAAAREYDSVGVVADPWFYTASFYPQTVAPRPTPFKIREQFRLAATSPRVLRYVPRDPDTRLEWDVRLIEELKPEAIVFSSFEQEGYERLALMPGDSPEKERYTHFWLALNRDYSFVQAMGSPNPVVHDMMYIRPKLQIWKRKLTSSSTP